MKKIGIFNVPEKWEEITIAQLKQLKEIKESASIQTNLEILKIFNPDVDILSADFQSVIEGVSTIYSVFQTSPTALKSDGTYTINGQTYKLTDVEQIDFQTFIDFQNLAGGNSSDEWERIKNIHLIISLLTEERTPDDIREFAKEIEKNVDVVTATSLLVFFSEKLTAYIVDSPLYLEIAEKMKKNEKENLTTV